ncbi:MAG: type II toxin-antitoxin system HicB family antitoxin [Deltaproteobacteria bacterium]|jgi:predicted HicB family RNase H-like nuclease|nr:type II toxin-antitoxin system HicB family antitoxin [Deltaproteobacteria bacterium]
MSVLTYKGYYGRIEYDERADIFHGQVMNLTDIVTFQSRSIDELKQALADSVDDYLEFCDEEGKTPEKPYSGRFNVRIDPEAHQRLALEAGRRGVSLNCRVAEILSKYVEHQG